MEMEEHSPSQGKPGKLPIIRCECLLSHLGARSAHGNVRWKLVIAQWRAGVKPTHVAPLDKSLGNPIDSLSRP